MKLSICLYHEAFRRILYAECKVFLEIIDKLITKHLTPLRVLSCLFICLTLLFTSMYFAMPWVLWKHLFMDYITVVFLPICLCMLSNPISDIWDYRTYEKQKLKYTIHNLARDAHLDIWEQVKFYKYVDLVGFEFCSIGYTASERILEAATLNLCAPGQGKISPQREQEEEVIEQRAAKRRESNGDASSSHRDSNGEASCQGELNPVGAEGQEELNPVGAEGQEELNPVGAEGQEELNPVGAEGQEELDPVGAEGQEELDPVGAEGQEELDPVGAEGQEELDPVGAEGQEELNPVGAGGQELGTEQPGTQKSTKSARRKGRRQRRRR